MYITCTECGAEGDADLPEIIGEHGLLACPACGQPVTIVDMGEWAGWIDRWSSRKQGQHAAGTLGTRIQSRTQTDAQIDRDGLAAELAAAIVLCPGNLALWIEAAQAGGCNRGRDLLPAWTGLPLPVEVKTTRYRDERRGCLIVRPPRWTPGEMKPQHVDDSVYVLTHSFGTKVEMLGWIDRDGLLARGKRNPIPVQPGQRETWGIHWRGLNPTRDLSKLIGASVRRAKLLGQHGGHVRRPAG